MKKLITFFMTIILCACLFAGCEQTFEIEHETTDNNKSMFILVEQTTTWKIVYHRDTRVMYAVSDSSRNLGNFTVLVNADGTPMIWEGE